MEKSLLMFVVGLISLYLGADWLIKGSSRMARHLGVNALVIGLTVVAMGTSAPELLVAASSPPSRRPVTSRSAT
ncbi:MAG: hypothetical protein GWN99_05805 [Gemmatimonadetes bacterium]|nr:hypothetical protein [Gemmatimonadota bacterium]NIS00578.1 hypothetical protein [Gemmatimonadota bacterium]NIT66238.1 hypothetical protein [Gemmatimonadota bacterium]NIU54705.1 hypothetical protein [Gemmatimonadota bacterium]NIV22800.1 hypothetical protein [Gemmatimonadota bacterium]